MKYIGLFDNQEDIVTKEKLDEVEGKIPTKTSDLTNDSGFITSTDVPVKSVNGQTGIIVLDADAVGALPDTTAIPSKTSDLTNDSGYITNAALDGYAKETDIPTNNNQLTNGAGYITASQAPVQSVNNKTGAVSLTASDVSAIPSTLAGTAGQVLTKTADGQEWGDVAKELPTVTTSDNGKFLRVVSGVWSAAEIANANGGSF